MDHFSSCRSDSSDTVLLLYGLGSYEFCLDFLKQNLGHRTLKNIEFKWLW